MKLKKFKLWNGNVTQAMQKRFQTTTLYKTTIEALPCPSCTSKTITTTMLEQGKDGWEAHFTCQTCHTEGVINETGFHFNVQIKGHPTRENQP